MSTGNTVAGLLAFAFVLVLVAMGSPKGGGTSESARKGSGASLLFLLVFGPVIWMLTPVRTIARRLSRTDPSAADAATTNAPTFKPERAVAYGVHTTTPLTPEQRKSWEAARKADIAARRGR